MALIHVPHLARTNGTVAHPLQMNGTVGNSGLPNAGAAGIASFGNNVHTFAGTDVSVPSSVSLSKTPPVMGLNASIKATQVA